MNQFAYAVMYAWIPVLLALFLVLPPRRAVIVGLIASWLFLPTATIQLQGIPNYTKFSATASGLMLGVLLFDTQRMLDLRPRWFDLPMAVYCLVPLASCLANGQSPYESLSASTYETIIWGMPYLIGRAYFSDPEALRELAVGIVGGGLIYAPLCVYESQFGQVLNPLLYGFNLATDHVSIRFGGYRPIVFMTTGLELGMWMTAATLTAFALWRSGAARRIGPLPAGVALGMLAVITINCRSIGALMLLALGVVTLELIRRTGSTRWAWMLLAIAPAYIALRYPGLWDGKTFNRLMGRFLGWDRVWSYEYRLIMENELLARARRVPLLGSGTRPIWRMSLDGRDIITDGLWLIAVCRFGLIGLIGLTTALLLPLGRFIRQQPPALWSGPRLAPAAGLAILLGIYMIDNLLNAMVNPVYTVAAGGLIALAACRGGSAASPAADRAALLAAAGRAAEAEPAYRRAIAEAHAGGSADRAVASGGLADLLLATGRAAEAEVVGRDALASLEAGAAASRDADPRRLAGLADTRERLARILAARGRADEAARTREAALTLREAIVAADPSPEARAAWADGANDLAWLLANGPDPGRRDPGRAARLAERAIAVDPRRKAYWNTLGAAYCRLGAWPAAVEALHRSLRLGAEGAGFDYALLALAHRGRGDRDAAIACLRRLDAWIREHGPASASLLALRDEAAAPDRTAAVPARIAQGR